MLVCFSHTATTDDSWKALAVTFPAGVTLETYLLSQNIGLLRNILYHHIIDGLHPTSSLGNINLTTLNGDAVSVVLFDGAISFDGAYVLESDWTFDNGIVHIIDSVLLPDQAI